MVVWNSKTEMFSDRILSAAFCRATDQKWKFSQQDTTDNDWRHCFDFDIILLIWIFKNFKIRCQRRNWFECCPPCVYRYEVTVKGTTGRQVLLIVALIVADIPSFRTSIYRIGQTRFEFDAFAAENFFFSNSDFTPLLGDDQSTPPLSYINLHRECVNRKCSH